MPRIEELFETNTILNYLQERQQPAMAGEELFPERKIQGLSFEYLKGANNLPVVASVHAFDTETEIASREGIAKVSAEVALIKRKIRMDERLIISLNKPRDNAEQRYAIEQVFNDVDSMVMAVRARVEAMRMEVMSSGKLQINENGVAVTINYGVPNDHKEVLLDDALWTASTATPLDDLHDWVDKIVADTGVRPTRALTSRAVVNALLKHTTIRKAIYGVNSDRIPTRTELNQLLSTHELPVFATYDAMARAQKADGTYGTFRYFPEDKVVLLPPGTLGDTIYGLTAEEIELTNKPGVDISKVGNIIAEIYKTNDPVARWTKAVATAIPSFPMADQVFIAKVK